MDRFEPSNNRRPSSRTYSPYSAFEGRSPTDSVNQDASRAESTPVRTPGEFGSMNSVSQPSYQPQPQTNMDNGAQMQMQMPHIQQTPPPRKPIITHSTGESNAEGEVGEDGYNLGRNREIEREHEGQEREAETPSTDSSASELEVSRRPTNRSYSSSQSQNESQEQVQALVGNKASTNKTRSGVGSKAGNGRRLSSGSGTGSVTGTVLGAYTNAPGAGNRPLVGSVNAHSRRLSSSGSIGGVEDAGYVVGQRTASPGPMANNNNGNGAIATGTGVGLRAASRQTPPSSFRVSNGRNSFGSSTQLQNLSQSIVNGQDVTDNAHPLDGGNDNGVINADVPTVARIGDGNGSGVSNRSQAIAYDPYSQVNFNGYHYPPVPPSSSPPPQPLPANVSNVIGYGNGIPSSSSPSPVSPLSSNGHAYSTSFSSAYASPIPRNANNSFVLNNNGYTGSNSYIANSAAMAMSSPSRNGSTIDLVPFAARINGVAGPGPATNYNNIAYGGSESGLRRASVDDYVFVPPQAPFAQGQGHVYPPPPSQPGTPIPGTPGTSTPELRHAGSVAKLREPFLSPASRRSSSVWVPPVLGMYASVPNTAGLSPGGQGGYGSGFFGAGGNGSASNLALNLPGQKEPLPSSALKRKLSVSQKPWLRERPKGERASWWLTFVTLWIGAIIGAVVIYFGYSGVDVIEDEGNLCSVLDATFDGSDTLDTSIWTKNVSLGGFGNGEFEMMTDDDENLFIKNGQLYIMPTLTSDEIGTDSVFDGYTYDLSGCTETWNASACSVTSKNSTSTVINPVKSARISTRNSSSGSMGAYGKVEVVAKMPKGDWLWPAIWMLPTEEKYGAWPLSGEMDLVESRGNDANYGGQGRNYVRSSMVWGPMSNVISSVYGWQETKRTSYADGFHTYTLEWSEKFIRMSVDKRTTAMLTITDIKKKSFWTRGDFPETAISTQNGTAGNTVAVSNPWEGQSNSAPFDQEFYLVIDLAVGGTSGWFPDGVGGKMWLDSSVTAMTDFAKKQDEWYATWPTDEDERALRVKSVKMWNLC